MSKYLWRELGRLGEGRPFGGRVEHVLAGTMGGGYASLWAVTDSHLVTLAERVGASRAFAHSEISGVVRPDGAVVGVLAGGADALTLRSFDDVAGFASALAARARVPVGGIDGLFTEGGYVPFAGAVTRVRGEYLGRHAELPAGRVVLAFDDTGVQLATVGKPWWRVAMLPWDEVRELAVEGSEETRQRVTVARVMLLGPLAMAVPKDENTSRAYITVAAASGDLVVRVDGVSPPELRVRLGDVLRRPAGAPEQATGLVDEIGRLAELHAGGVLTADEFAAAKRKLLGL